MICNIFATRFPHLALTTRELNMADWNEIKEQLKIKIIHLTDNKILIASEKQEDLIHKLEVRLGKTREVILKILAQL
jgi:hypothetical protein